MRLTEWMFLLAVIVTGASVTTVAMFGGGRNEWQRLLVFVGGVSLSVLALGGALTMIARAHLPPAALLP